MSVAWDHTGVGVRIRISPRSQGTRDRDENWDENFDILKGGKVDDGAQISLNNNIWKPVGVLLSFFHPPVLINIRVKEVLELS